MNRDVCLQMLGQSAQEVIQGVEAVSLGSYCGTKAPLRKLGLTEASLPFDWMHTRVEGLIHWLQNGFDDFFSVDRRLDVERDQMQMSVNTAQDK